MLGQRTRLAAYGFLNGELQKFNPMHVPKGSAAGGEFASKDGAETTITAYHGSPKEFTEFSTKKLLSGAGQNDYGKGVYLAANKEVAQHYKNELSSGGTGRLYEVQFKVTPGKLLQWDIPLKEQSASVQRAFKSITLDNGGEERGGEAFRQLTNAQFKYPLGDHDNGRDALISRATNKLRASGLQGIKYRDEGARGSTDAKAYNYVIYDPKRISIVKMSKLLAGQELLKFNVNHVPAGSSQGGEFASADGDGLPRDAEGNVTPDHSPVFASAELQALSEKHTDEMTQAELDAVQEYVDGGDKAINNTLRGREVTPDQYKLDDVTVDIDGDIKNLDRALGRTTIPTAMSVYRGGSTAHLEGLKPGDLLTDKGFLSTSANLDVASRFGVSSIEYDSSKTTGALFKIDLPAGAHAALVKNFNFENEVLLPRDSTFRVTSVKHDVPFNIKFVGPDYKLNIITLEPVLAKSVSYEMDGGGNRFMWGGVISTSLAKFTDYPMPAKNRILPIGFNWQKDAADVDRYKAAVFKALQAVQKKNLPMIKQKLAEHLGKTEEEEAIWRQLSAEIAAALDLGELELLIDEAEAVGGLVAERAARMTLAQFGYDTVFEIVDRIDGWTADWAEQSAAELIGMRYNEDGELEESRNPTTRIDDSTRNMVRDKIHTGLREGLTLLEIGETLEGLGPYPFSEARAGLIAATEIARAHSYGALHQAQILSQEEGVHILKYWMVADTPCPICEGNNEEGLLELDMAFQSDDEAPPGHPICRCALGLHAPDDPISPEEIAHYNSLDIPQDHDDREALNLAYRVRDLLKFNPRHAPAGSSEGGEFVSADGGLFGNSLPKSSAKPNADKLKREQDAKADARLKHDLVHSWLLNEEGSWTNIQAAARTLIKTSTDKDTIVQRQLSRGNKDYQTAKSALDAINASKPLDYPLYRGIHATTASYNVGDTFSESLASWTPKQVWAGKFASDEYQTYGRGGPGEGGTHDVVFTMKGTGMKALPISRWADAESPQIPTQFSQRGVDEHLASGEYRVTKVNSKTIMGGTVNPITVEVERIGDATVRDLARADIPTTLLKYQPQE